MTDTALLAPVRTGTIGIDLYSTQVILDRLKAVDVSVSPTSDLTQSLEAQLQRRVAMSELLVSLVCFVIPIVCIWMGAWLALTISKASVRAHSRFAAHRGASPIHNGDPVPEELERRAEPSQRPEPQVATKSELLEINY